MVARAEHIVDDLELALAHADVADLTDQGVTRWRRGDAPRELLVKPTIVGLLRQAALEWALLIGLWALMALAPWWVDVPLMLLVAGRLHAFGVILHDATHMPLRAKTLGVRVLEVLVAYPIATTLNAMRYHHLRHHRDSGMASDPYFKAGVDEHRGLWVIQWLRGLLLMPFWTIRAPYGALALLFPGMRQSYARVFLQDRSGEDVRDSVEVLACARAELGQVLFQLPLIVAFVIWPATMAWNFAIPATITGLLASYRVLCEHRYQANSDRKVATIVKTTRDHHLRAWEQVFLAPRNIGFHVVHHLHPQVAQEHLPALREWYRARHADYP